MGLSALLPLVGLVLEYRSKDLRLTLLHATAGTTKKADAGTGRVAFAAMAGVLPETVTLTVHEAWRLQGDRLVAIDPQAAGDYSIRGVPLGEGEQAILVCDLENTIVARLDQVAPGETQAT